MDLEVQSRLSFYKKIADLGGKENVFLVRHIETGQIYVEKVLDVFDKQIYDMLMRECFPMIPKIYECLEEDGRLYIIEEYIQGVTLEDYIEKYGALEAPQATKVLMELCSILNTLHDRSTPIIHRDIKPTNVMLCGEFEHSSTISSVYLIDFNTARRFVENTERDTVQMGTMGFAAPEQYGFGQSDVRTDIYALGVVTNYMLCGKMLSEEIYSKGDALSNVIARATKIDPEQRFQNVGEIAEALGQNKVGNEPSYNNPYSKAYNNATAGHGGEMPASSEKNTEVGTEGLKTHNRRRFLPPGFREGKISHMLVALLYYGISFWCAFTLEVDTNGKPATGTDLFANRVVLLIILMLCAIFWGNYLGVWDRLPLMNKKGWHIVGLIIYPIAIFFVLIMILVSFEYLLL